MILSDLAIKKPVFAWMFMFGLILFGAICFSRMGISQLPDVDFPTVNISLNWPGASPEAMETDVVDLVEDAVMSLQGITNVSSTSRNGSASVKVEFDLSRDIEVAMQEVQAKVTQVQRRLPKEMEPPTISKTNPDDQPILWLSVSSPQATRKELMLYVRDQLKYQFSTIAGVGEVMLGGFVDPNMRIWLDLKELNRNLLTVNDVINTFNNEHSEVPGGQIETTLKNINVRTMGEVSTATAFGNLLLNTRGGGPNFQPLKLSQVARVEEGLADTRSLSRANGIVAVGLGIRKQRGSNAVAVAKAVKSKMKELEKKLPPGYQLGINFDSTQFIEESVQELNFTLVLSILLTSLVCWLFLGSWSATFNVLLAIPTSIIGAFIPLYFLGFTLNTFTLMGLSLAVGIVVDDAIMVLENIFRHREKGKSQLVAAIIGAREITFAALAATAAIVAIFLPVAFMDGIIGKFFFQFGVTMTVAVLFSLLEALTLTPMRCAQFSGTHQERASIIGRTFEFLMSSAQHLYEKILQKLLNHPWLTIGCALIFFVISLLPIKWLNKELSPAQDQGRFMVRIKTPVGSSLDWTNRQVLSVENYFKQQKDVERYFVSVGGGMGNSDTNSATMFITMKELKARSMNKKTGRPRTQTEFMNYLRKDLKNEKGTKISLQDLSMRGFSNSRGFPIEFTLKGRDWNVLADLSQKIMQQMEQTHLLHDVDSDYNLGMPELQIIPNREAASAHGVAVSTIGQTISALIGGLTVGRYPSGGHRYDIRIQLPKSLAQKSALSQIKVRNNRGELIPLQTLVSVTERSSLQQISRDSRERAISFFANIKTGASQSLIIEKLQKITDKMLPPGYRIEFGGSSKSFKETFGSLIFALLLGIIVSYMVLASQFNSFVDPFTVLIALPFSVSGAFLSLWVTDQSINMYSMIGLILLMGIVKKNSILLVDFVNQIRDAGEIDIRQAILQGCPIRLRPILMTSFATIAGSIPAALAIGPGAETRIPMSIVVIGGVFVSTFLTLLVVPCVYFLVARFQKRELYSKQLQEAFAQADALT